MTYDTNKETDKISIKGEGKTKDHQPCLISTNIVSKHSETKWAADVLEKKILVHRSLNVVWSLHTFKTFYIVGFV